MTLKLSKNSLFFEKYEDKVSMTSISIKNPSLKHKVAFNFQFNLTSDYYTAYPSVAMLDPNSECQISFERHPKVDDFYKNEKNCGEMDIFILQSIQVNDKMNKKLDKMEKNDKMMWSYLETEAQKNRKKIRIKEIMLSIHVNDDFNKVNESDKLMTQEFFVTKKKNYNHDIENNYFSTVPAKFLENKFIQNCNEYIYQKNEFLNSSKTVKEISSFSKEYEKENKDIRCQELYKSQYESINKHEDSLQRLEDAFFCSTRTSDTHISDNTAVTVVDLSHVSKICNQEENEDDSSEFWSDDNLTNDEINLECFKTVLNIVEPRSPEKDFNKGIEHLQVWKLIGQQSKEKSTDTTIVENFSEDVITPTIAIKPFLSSTILMDSSPSLLSLSQASTKSSIFQATNCSYIHSYKELSDSIGKTLFGKELLFYEFSEFNIDISPQPAWMQGILDLQKEFQAMIDHFDQTINFHPEDFTITKSCASQTNITDIDQTLGTHVHCIERV
ncbi:hypothetical protein PCANB_002666 [Pneumocystis canis]|nr:hypothetical protein PCANB_002666 [Pneumocystis canis]